MAGRPSLLTPELQEAICKSIGAGLTFTDACRVNHIGVSTFMAWKEKGEAAPDGPYRELIDAVKEAEAVFKQTHLITITKASESSWQAAAWLLERKYPQEFALRQQIAVSDKLEQFIKAFDEIK